MKKELKRVLLVIMVTGLLTVSLVACKGSGDAGNTDAVDGGPRRSAIPVSEAMAQEGIWFYCKDPVTKDAEITYTLIFDGNGNVTRYTSDFTFAELKDLSNKEIIEFVKERDAIGFEEQMQRYIRSSESALEDGSSYLLQYEPVYFEELIAAVNSAEYQEPTPYPYSLKIITDGTGNETVNEILTYNYTTWDQSLWDEYGGVWYEESWEAYSKYDGELELFVAPTDMTVYDKQFNGFGNLYTIVDEEHPGFILDYPDTEGIETE